MSAPATAITAEAPAAAERPVWRTVLALAWPALLQNWLIVAVTLTDRLLAGRFQEALAPDTQAATQAAQTTAAYLHWFLSTYPYLVTVGATALVAHLVGAGQRREANRVLHQAMLLGLVLGLAGSALGLAYLRPGLHLLGLRGDAAVYAAEYMRPLLWQLPLQMLGLIGIACLVGAGDTRTGLFVLGGVAVLNLPLAWLFFHWLGFVGIAVGTAVSQAWGGVAVLTVLLHGRAGLRLRPGLLRPRARLMRRLLRVSVPAAIDSLSMQVGYLWFMSLVNGLGEVAGAAHGIALAWEALGYQSGAAFGTAAITAVGQALGAGRPERAERAGWVAFGLGAGLMTLMGAVFFTLAVPMFELFCPHPKQAAIVAMGVPVLRLVAFGMPALASCMILAWALRGAGDTRFPMLFTWVGFFAVRIPLTYWLISPEVGLGLFGAWLAMCADMYVRGLCVLARFVGGRWKTIRV
jgi:MATE family, multidrug efflux pump